MSRVTPVHTAVRNCTRDEGRPFEFGNQVLISSHRGERQGRTLPQAMPAFASSVRKGSVLLCAKVLCIRGKPGRSPSRVQNHDGAKGYSPSWLLNPCLDCNTSALFMPTATFPPTECPTAPASYLSACGVGVYGWNGPHATPGPLPDALGGTRVSSVLGPVTLNPSARDRGQRGSAS